LRVLASVVERLLMAAVSHPYLLSAALAVMVRSKRKLKPNQPSVTSSTVAVVLLLGTEKL
jgi:hypothetical protein